MTGQKNFDRLDYTYKMFAIIALAITAAILAQDIVVPILISAFLSVILLPVVKWLEKRLSLTLSVIVVLLITFLVFAGMVWVIGDQLTKLVQDLPNLENKFNALVDNVSNEIRRMLGMSRAEQNQMEREAMRNATLYVTNLLVSTTSTISLLIQLPIYIFLFLIYRDRFKAFFVSLLPQTDEFTWKKDIKTVLQGYISGLLIVTLIIKAAPAGDELFQPLEHSILHSEDVLIAPVTERVGTVIGPYKLLEKIGEGGMGVVYMAEQETPVRRKVALKIIKLGMDTRQVIARFEAEKQALAMMEHPHIAQVLDAGATDTGRPYFVMELVKGVPITEFCDADKLSIRERLNLFIPVCYAIQSAHQKGIIHRDIKPSNVLVTMHNGTPHPMVIDFGVAKATNQKLTEKTLFTNFATMIGTPAYMSPEQAEMSKLDVDTRSDVYSLGVLLYELLTGTTPFPEERLRSVAYGEMQRIISEEEPERPSTRQIETAMTKSVVRDSRPQIDSDLDWVVMKCLEKDRNRRYDTANALVGDIQAHLNDEPVVARPPSMPYRFHKFVRRNRTASTAVALITLAVLFGIIASSWALFRERAARRQSEERLTAALAFVDDVFNKVAPKLENLVGAADAQEGLGDAGLKFIKRLRSGANADPAIRLALARLLSKRALAQNPGNANPTGEYATGLMCAREAAQLLESKSLPASEGERLILLWWAKLAEVQCLYGLGRVEEGISHLDELDRLLDQLAKVPQFGSRMANRQHQSIRNNAGNNTMIAGRPREAIDRFFLPAITNDWARSIKTNSWDDEIESVMNPNGNMVVALLLLKEFDAMLPYANEAARLIEILVQHSPRNARWMRYRMMSLAHHGYAVVRSGDVVAGLAELKKSRDEAEEHAKLDPANDQIAQVRSIIAALQAMALGFWSEEASADLSERHRRLTEGEAYLAEAEKLSGKTKAVDFKIYLSRASEDIAAAKSNLLSASTVR